jgi:hypothetical protein
VTYTYQKTCNLSRLEDEVRDSDILTALDYITATETETTVVFKAALSGGDETILTALVTAHVNTEPENGPITVIVDQQDEDTGGLKTSPKFAPDGWTQKYFETEFETCRMNSIHEKTWTNIDIGYSSLQFYKLSGGVEVECADQADIDANCTRTDLSWMPDHDYAIKSGFVAQTVVPSENLYIWALGVDLPANLGGPQSVFAEGGLNMIYAEARSKNGLDGVAATVLRYSHPQLGAGAGTNKLRLVVRHSAGFRHRIQFVLEIFSP